MYNVRTYTHRLSNPPNTQTANANHTILGASTGGPINDDIRYLVDIWVANQPPSGVSIGSEPDAIYQNIQITGWICETMITNLADYPVFIDMYYWRAIKDVPSNLPTINQIWSSALLELEPNMTTDPGKTSITTEDYGVTPFQGNDFAKKIRIWKKTRVKLAAGSVTQIETRSGRNYYINYGYASSYSMLRNVTQGVYFVCYGSPGPAEEGSLARPVDLQITTNKNFTWRVNYNNVKRGMHDNVGAI